MIIVAPVIDGAAGVVLKTMNPNIHRTDNNKKLRGNDKKQTGIPSDPMEVHGRGRFPVVVGTRPG